MVNYIQLFKNSINVQSKIINKIYLYTAYNTVLSKASKSLKLLSLHSCKYKNKSSICQPLFDIE